MAAKGEIPTPALMKQIKDVIRHYKRMTEERERGPDAFENDHQAPEVYVVQAPVGGVPAFEDQGTTVGTGTGTFDDEVLVGAAYCQVYELVQREAVIGTADVEKLVAVEDYKILVHNLADEEIEEGTYFVAVRDKFGDWWAVGAGGGGGTRWVRITSIFQNHKGWNPGTVIKYFPILEQWQDVGPAIWIECPHSDAYPIEDGDIIQKGVGLNNRVPRYLAKKEGTYLGRAVYVAELPHLLKGCMQGDLAWRGEQWMDIYDDQGFTGQAAIVKDWLLVEGQEILAGTRVIAMYSPQDRNFYVVSAACGVGAEDECVSGAAVTQYWYVIRGPIFGVDLVIEGTVDPPWAAVSGPYDSEEEAEEAANPPAPWE